jgi:hypothetical protein
MSQDAVWQSSHPELQSAQGYVAGKGEGDIKTDLEHHVLREEFKNI